MFTPITFPRNAKINFAFAISHGRIIQLCPRQLLSLAQKRSLSIHEHHSQDLLRQFDLPVAPGKVISKPSEVKGVLSEIAGPWILKSQILAGGRGKGKFVGSSYSGIRGVKSSEEAESAATSMLGHKLATKQTPPEGVQVNKLYVAQKIDYKDEFYLAMTIDRAEFSPVIIISKEGGVNVESAEQDQMHKFHFSISTGITPAIEAAVKEKLELNEPQGKAINAILRKMAKLFKEKEATLLEINPLVRTAEGQFICLDAKFSFDDAAEKRQAELFALRDRSQERAEEVEAEKYGLVYIRLDGNIGNVVNGAGLAMATNDAVELYGGKSANFLDAGGQATKETMLGAFKIILSDPRVKVILVNIYGGIIRCDMIAESIIAAAAEIGPLTHPMVVRLQGTNSEAGLKLIEESGLGLYTESEFGAAAKKAVELAKDS